MTKVWSIRVSSEDQNEARQVELAKKEGADKIFIDKLSGKDLERPQFQAMMNYVREGDEVYFHDLSRAGRNLQDVLNSDDYASGERSKYSLHGGKSAFRC